MEIIASSDISYTKLLAMLYVTARSYDMMVPRHSESKEHKQRAEEKPQLNERYSFFTVGPFSKLGRFVFIIFAVSNFVGLAFAHLDSIILYLANVIGIDATALQRFFAIALPIRIPYAPSFFQWNGLGDIIAVSICIFAAEIRAWSMRELGRFFTFKLGVSKDQHIVQSGPYQYVRHPSYTGLILMSPCCAYLIAIPTLQEIIRPLVVDLLEISIKQTELPNYLTQAITTLIWLLNDPHVCYLIGLLISIVVGLITISVIAFVRLPQEEKMLSDSFGEEWSRFASTRARVLPYIY
ncbi:hypothetical protein BDF19DRAFT_428630 [Syncephalis fuscata]|nr:hypothetical protein BDF19DRAFT_428630 [Syncephalis fuscata]